MIEEVLNLLPLHLQKTNTLKFVSCLKVVLNYLDSILNDDIGMNSIKKAHSEYLDYHGNKLVVPRLGRSDEIYRPFLQAKRFMRTNLPTTDNLLELANQMTGYYPVELQTKYRDEEASQYIKYVVPYTTDLNNFPDLNSICDAGARIYQDVLLNAHRRTYRPVFIAGRKGRMKQYIKEIEITPKGE